MEPLNREKRTILPLKEQRQDGFVAVSGILQLKLCLIHFKGSVCREISATFDKVSRLFKRASVSFFEQRNARRALKDFLCLFPKSMVSCKYASERFRKRGVDGGDGIATVGGAGGGRKCIFAVVIRSEGIGRSATVRYCRLCQRRTDCLRRSSESGG